jgi:peptide/nickel transport system permease protein
VVLCVVMLSISSLFYIIVGQYLFARVLKLARLGLHAEGLDAGALPGAADRCCRHAARLGTEARLYRAMFLEEIGKDYVRTARAKGLAETAGAVRHVLRNALIPIITSAGGYLPYVFLGSWCSRASSASPAWAPMSIEAIGKQDFAIVRTMVFLGSVLYIASYILIDIAYTWVDPRVRLG